LENKIFKKKMNSNESNIETNMMKFFMYLGQAKVF
jgi:hypothetical protein